VGPLRAVRLCDADYGSRAVGPRARTSASVPACSCSRVHLLNGLSGAELDYVPVLAITGMQETQLLGTSYQQEVHLREAVPGRGRL
jgi:hypothetical protein